MTFVNKGKYLGTAPDDLARALQSDGYSVFEWQDGPGAYYSPHSHPHDEYIVIKTGEIEFECGGVIHSLHAGDELVLPSQTVHTATNRSKQSVTYYICTKEKSR